MSTEAEAAVEQPVLALPHIMELVFNRPLLLTEEKANLVAWVIAGRIGIEVAIPEPSASRFVGQRRGATRYSEINGTAIIPVIGSLVNRGAWVGASSGLVSYEGLQAQLLEVAADKDINRIILDINSGGGEAAGMFDLADTVRGVREKKPVIAVVNNMAASAAYGIASQANRIVTAKTGVTGSIGVVMVHLDHSGMLQQKGVAATLIYAGKHKVDGNPFGPLSESVKAELKAEIGDLYEDFVAKVAEGRPSLTADAIRATEARVFSGEKGLRAGLADEGGTIFDVLEGRAAQLPRQVRGATLTRSTSMSKDNPAPGTETPGTYTQAQLDVAVKAALAEGQKAGITAERARIVAIIGLDAAKERMKQAITMATTTDLTADQAKALLEASPTESKQAGAVPPKDRQQPGGTIDPTVEKPNASAAWKKAVAKVNATLPGARQ